jgi:thiol-disulfide isomerase/thioredoxin
VTKKIIISLAVIAALVSGILYARGLLSVHQGMTPPASLAALKLEKDPKPAPAVTFADATGAHHGLDAFKGRYVLVNLWATWCGPCVNELPALARLATFAPGLKVVPINMDTTRIDPAAFLKDHQAGNLPVYSDSERMLMRSFLAVSMPLTVLIDPNGKVVARADGPADWDNPESVAYFKRITGS